MMKKLTPSLALLSVLVSCGMNTSPKDIGSLKLVNSNIISIRNIADGADTIMVRLKTPALIETATIEGKKITINEAQKAQVLKEQEDFVREIKLLDPEIEVLYSTKIVMNSVTIVARPSIMGKVNGLTMVKNASSMSYFAAPDLVTQNEIKEQLAKKVKDLNSKSSVSFIGADEARKQGITGKGLRIGIIDTGIDYTHAMFGGSGSAEDFKSQDPTAPVTNYPAKIEGGIDLVGDAWSPASPVKELRIPKPDTNPLDVRSGHGTHVAGTVSGIAVGEEGYDGVAPDALLHGIKVFGANSTGDAVVIAALEYSVDPNGDLDVSDRLDVVNLSLGGAYGKPSINYSEAVTNIVRAGVSFVAAAGNSGDAPYIVGAPSTSTDALSVAAGIDYMEHNVMSEGTSLNIDGVESIAHSPYATFSKLLAAGETISNEAVHVGLATEDLSADLAAKVAGKIALVDRGVSTFSEKAERALKAGAVGVLILNNAEGEASIPGGSEIRLSIPVAMVSKAEGDAMKSALSEGKAVDVTFSGDIKKARTEYIDTITNFSSRGPRSEDGLIKPEIVAPGQQIISATTGTGNGYNAQNGTSMAAPHMAGVMGLMMQKFPELSPLEHKHVLMATAKIIKDHKGNRYPVTAQGAGRVDVMKALNTKLIPSRGGFSLGKVNLLKSNNVSEKITLKNVSGADLELSVVTDFNGGISLNERGTTIKIAKGETKEVNFNFTLDVVSQDRANYEGFVKLLGSDGEVASFPVLAVVHQASAVATLGKINTAKQVSFVLDNKSALKGTVLPFNLVAMDDRKVDPGTLSNIRNRTCDLQSVGYRVMEKEDKDGKKVKSLQVGFKLFESVSDWQACQLSVLVDTDNDGVADVEWAGSRSDYLPGLSTSVGAGFFSIVLDAHKAREIRAKFESEHRQTAGETKASEDYRSAVTGLGIFSPFQGSSVAVLEMDVKTFNAEKLNVKVVSMTTGAGNVEEDDYLGNKWFNLDLKNSNNLPESIEVNGQGKKLVKLPKMGKDIILYSPTNADGRNGGRDLQQIKL